MKQLEVALPTGTLSLQLEPGRIPLQRLVGFAARQNPKRPFLFVSKLLGKHYPVRPRLMAWSYRKLAQAVLANNPDPDTVWIGMAETATGLGYGVYAAAASLVGARRDAGLYLQSTRYRIDGQPYLSFEESHSHATDFWLYHPEAAMLRDRFLNARQLVLVDDEISTGNTFARLVHAYREINPKLQRVSIVSLVNFAAGEARQRVEAQCGMPVEWLALRHGSLAFAHDDSFTLPPMPKVVATESQCKKALLAWPGRLGIGKPVEFSEAAVSALAAQLKPAAASAKPILVAGTGECIAPAYLLGRALEQRGYDIRVQSTTRSPILVGGAIRCALPMPDNYGEGIHNFLYNVEPGTYRDIVVCHETPIDAALLSWLPGLEALAAQVAADPENAQHATLSVRRFG